MQESRDTELLTDSTSLQELAGQFCCDKNPSVTFLEAAIMEFLLPLLMLSLACVEGPSQKKGLAVPSEDFRCGDVSLLHGVAWWYDWLQKATYHNRCGGHVLANRVPMVWGWRNRTHPHLHIPSNAHAVLGYNEPNFHAQANLTPHAAARGWRQLQQQVGNKLLVSPSAAPCGDLKMCNAYPAVWFQQFFDACTDCRVDFLATHGYWCDAEILMNYLEELWNRFHKKIWLTEFSCPQKSSVAVQLSFMKAALPRLEAAHYVARYAWFATRFHGDDWVLTEANLLQQNSSALTELGRFYMTF